MNCCSVWVVNKNGQNIEGQLVFPSLATIKSYLVSIVFDLSAKPMLETHFHASILGEHLRLGYFNLR
jgi:hypothetical protein